MSGRMWWAAPLAVAAATGAAFAAFTLPELTGSVAVPDRLVVHQSASTTTPTATPSASPASGVTPTPRVVVPDRPVVRESDDPPGGRQPDGESTDRTPGGG